MYAKLLLITVILLPVVYYSWVKYKQLVLQRNAYVLLKEFALRAEENMNKFYVDIRKILSEAFKVDQLSAKDNKVFYTLGLEESDAKELMDYTIKFGYLDIDALRKESKRFTEFASTALDKQEQEYKKRSPALLCPPVCAMIALIVFL